MIAIGCDHRGYPAKRRIVSLLEGWGHEVTDFGCHGIDAVDYPDIAFRTVAPVAAGQYEIGILIDGGGTGMCIAANKVRGIRAAAVHDGLSARISGVSKHTDGYMSLLDFGCANPGQGIPAQKSGNCKIGTEGGIDVKGVDDVGHRRKRDPRS